MRRKPRKSKNLRRFSFLNRFSEPISNGQLFFPHFIPFSSCVFLSACMNTILSAPTPAPASFHSISVALFHSIPFRLVCQIEIEIEILFLFILHCWMMNKNTEKEEKINFSFIFLPCSTPKGGWFSFILHSTTICYLINSQNDTKKKRKTMDRYFVRLLKQRSHHARIVNISFLWPLQSLNVENGVYVRFASIRSQWQWRTYIYMLCYQALKCVV